MSTTHLYFDLFEDYNNSFENEYLNLINGMNNSNDKIFYQSYNFMLKAEKLGILRNALLDRTLDNSKYLNIDYNWLFMIDLDIYHLNIIEIMNSFYKLRLQLAQTQLSNMVTMGNRNKKISYSISKINNIGMCANGYKNSGDLRYYDTFPFVIKDKTGNHWGWEHPTKYSYQEITNLIKTIEFLKVESCFGGLAIYPLQAIFASKCKYTPTVHAVVQWPEWLQWLDTRKQINHDQASVMCEHVSMAYCLRDSAKTQFFVARDAILYRDKPRDKK